MIPIEPDEAPSIGASFFNALPMLGLLAAMLLLLLILIGHVRAEERARTFFNERGQEVGRSVTRGNTTTFENSRGQATGRAERRPDGTIILFDDKGRMIGSSRGLGIGSPGR
jgi:hypothetical protein